MPDEIIETEETEDVVEESSEKTEEETSKETIIDKIRTKIKDFTNKDEEVAEVVIPDDFTKAALDSGWSSEDIKDFAKDYSEDELKEMIPTLIGEDSEESEETLDTLEAETEETKDEDSQDDEQVKKLLERIEALEKAQGKSQEETEKQEFINLVYKASQTFDEMSKEFEVFGKTEELPMFPDGRLVLTSPQMKARSEVFDLAHTLKGTGMDFDTAMSVSLNAFKGKNLTKDVKRNLIKDLKTKEKRLSGKRTSHESGTKEMSGPDVIRAVLAKNNR
jgi:hypothetical protein